MALLNVHKIMMSAGCLFSALFAARCLFMGQFVMGLVFVSITVGLGVYFRWFLRTKAVDLNEE